MATELCEGTLKDLVKQRSFICLNYEDEIDILYQVTRGLVYLHKLNIFQVNLEPSSILFLNLPSSRLRRFVVPRKYQMKIAYSPAYSNGLTNNTDLRFPHGLWTAPEMYERTHQYTNKVDLFILGCVFGYTLSGGNHPFGKEICDRNYRIMTMKSMVLTRNDLKIPSLKRKKAFELIQSMLQLEAARRPAAEIVLDSKLFHCLFDEFQSGRVEGM